MASKWSNLDKAKSQLLLQHCFFASLLFRLPLIENEHIPTFCTDGKSIQYNPKFADTLNVKELMGVLVHELYHIIFEHALRRGKKDMEKWNAATDYAINETEKNQEFVLPAKILWDPQYKGLYAEQIYDKLPPLAKLKLPQGWNIGGIEDQKDANGRAMSEDEIDAASKEVKAMVKEAAIAAKMAGKLPMDIERLLGDLLNPKIPWREVLAKFLTVHVVNDVTWRLPNPKYISHGIYLPKLDEPQIGDMVFVVDTSGSITDKDLIDLMSEVRGILMAFPAKSFWLLGCDTHVASAQELSFQDEIKKPKGGGGTDYREPFKWVDKQGLDPACLIYLTDGECNSFPEKVPDYPVLWVLTQDPQWARDVWKNVKFGDVIVMDDREDRARRRR